ncbi:MAG TPA: VOC family protein [Vicinamibacterales bacterium]|nr:VOC family protein [Vicinamibacterales bacterium]
MADKLLGSFVWCELMTTDMAAAGSFYSKIVGWKTTPFSPDGSYHTFNTKSGPVAGMMVLPDEAKKMGAPPHWLMYVGTPNVDDTAQRVAQLRGRVLKQPADIPGVGRYAVVQDPYGTTFGLYQPATPRPQKSEPGAGDFSWFELYTPNPEGAWSFYQSLFGWEKTSAMDMGEMGTYQMFGRGGGIPSGGIMKPPPGAPAAWLPYIMVADAKGVAAAAQARGGTIVNGPMEVPGGDWIAQGMDPQHAMFAVHSRKPAVKAAGTARTAAPATASTAAKATADKSAGKAKKKAAKKKAAKKAPKKVAAARRAKPAKRATAKKAARKSARKAAKKAAKRKK